MALIFYLFFSGKLLSLCESWKNASCDGLMLKAWYEEKAWREYFEAELVRTLSISLESVQWRRSFYIYWVWIHWKSFLEFWLVWEGGNLVHTKVMLLKMTLCVSRRWGSWLWNVFFSFTLYVIALFPLFLHRTRNIRVDGWWPFLFIRRINHSKFWRCWCGGCNSTVERAITFYRQKIWLALHQFSNCWELKLEEEGALCPYFHQTLLLASQLMGPTSSWLGVMVKHHFLLAWPWK